MRIWVSRAPPRWAAPTVFVVELDNAANPSMRQPYGRIPLGPPTLLVCTTRVDRKRNRRRCRWSCPSVVDGELLSLHSRSFPSWISVDDEVSDHRHGTLRCIGEHAVPTPRKPLETNQMRREGHGDIHLTFDGGQWSSWSRATRCRCRAFTRGAITSAPPAGSTSGAGTSLGARC
jgi:hypothetical protein